MATPQTLLLISKTISGDSDAFEQLILSQKSIIFYIIRRLTNCPEDAEDISQEVALRIFQRISSLRNPEAFGSWVRTIAIRECMHHLAARRPTDPFEDLLDHENQLPETDPDCLPAIYVERLELRAEILAAFTLMPVTLQKVAVLYYLSGMHYREIAEFLDLTIGTVSAYLFRARKFLSKALYQS